MANIPGDLNVAVSIPYVRITNCCDGNDTGLYNIVDFDPETFVEGVYTYAGADLVTGQITFVSGQCYLIERQGAAGTPYPVLDLSVDFSYVAENCDDALIAGCPSCNDPLTKLVFTSCCNREVVETQGQLPPGRTQIVVQYTGPSGGVLQNICYEVTEVQDITPEEWALLPPAIPESFFSVRSVEGGTCDDYIEECPECPQLQCYRLITCDGVFFDTLVDLSDYVGQYIVPSGDPSTIYFVVENDDCTNPTLQLPLEFEKINIAAEECPCRCYEIVGTVRTNYYIDCDNNVVKDPTIRKFCSRTYPLVTGTPGEFSIVEGGNCVDGLCPQVCYALTNCDTGETIYSNLQTLSQYVNTSSVVTLLGYEGCWSVSESLDTTCETLTVTWEVNGELSSYTATLNPSFSPCGDKNVYTFSVNFTTYFISYNSETGNWVITSGGTFCSLDTPTIFATLDSDSDCPVATSSEWVPQFPAIISVQTDLAPGSCDCPVDVTIIQEFDSCNSCEPYVAYKLQNCEKIYEVEYTTQDLSAYVGQVIEDDCGCWTVEQIDYVPPSITLITVVNSFKTCNTCLAKYYRLTDCSGESADITTTTDLSQYVGLTIKIENCDTCWEVSETRTFTELAAVAVVESYDNCEACGIDVPCVCSKLTNLTTSEQTVSYIDCEDVVQQITLAIGETSEKTCLKKWVLPDLPEGEFLYAEYFGDCQHGVCPPPVFKNNRTVKPGYNTPICSAEKYDKITCKFAQAMYKDALEKRYGISNCCPDEDMKWIIQKELIDLQALKDPNYKCSACSCSCTKSSCNCKN